jgi:hypothetical protein
MLRLRDRFKENLSRQRRLFQDRVRRKANIKKMSAATLSFTEFDAAVITNKENEHENFDGSNVARSTGQHWPKDRLLA